MSLRYPVSKPSVTARERSLLLGVFDSNQLTHGPTVEAFERSLADKLNVGYVVACSSGTTALHLACAAFLKSGDEVLVPDLTFVATANAVRYAGAKPVLCDIYPDDWAISLEDAQKRLTPRTKAIVVVHLYGMPANMDHVADFANRHGLVVIEDAAEGLGGKWGKYYLGTLGEAGTFSFFGNKVVTTGEGGAVVTEEKELAEELRHLRGQGQHATRRYYHDVLGFNYRMTEMQAALGIGQLERFAELLHKRSNVMSLYRAWAKSEGFHCVNESAAPWLFTFYVPRGTNRERLQDVLRDTHGIDTRRTFVPLHELPIYQTKEEYPVATDIGKHGLSLPTYPDLADSDVHYITETVSKEIHRQAFTIRRRA